MASPNPPATIYDVAKKAGVSPATVSRMLNSPDKVNPNTRQRILAAIDQLGFVPQADARVRKLQKNRRIGVITPFFTAPAFVQRLRGIASVLSKVRYEMVIFPVESTTQLESYFGSIPITGNLDGLVIVSLPISAQYVQRLQSFNIPTVMIEFSHSDLSSVTIDDYAGGQLAAEYLLSKGHRQIAFMARPNIPEYTVHSPSQRFNGFRDALAKAGVDIPTEYLRLIPDTDDEIYQTTRDLMNLPTPPTAIFTALDIFGVGVVKAARQLKIDVPKRLAILGFDDLDISSYADLTTIRQHLDDSGRLATELLLAQVEEPSRPIQHVQLQLTLIERQTT